MDESAALTFALTLLKGAAIIGLPALALYWSYHRRFVWDWQYDECREEVKKTRDQLDILMHAWTDPVCVSRRLQELHIPEDGC